MIITLDDVSCLMHLPIKVRLLDHGRIEREEGFDMMVRHLGADPAKAAHEAQETRGAYARFSFWKSFIKVISWGLGCRRR